MFKIIHTDKDFVICEKAIGISSQNTTDGKENMPSLIAKELNIDAQSIYPVHRLDNMVGGTMVYALNRKSAGFLSREITENRMKKTYLAIVHGCPEEKEGVYKDLLFKDSTKNKSFVVKNMRKGVKEASLEYEVLKERDGFSLVKILLHTGRTHQIRVQFASRKMPLLGDRRYGSGKDNCSVALWSHSLEFKHMENSNNLTFTLEPDWDSYPWNLFK
jgi:23S rRNA pseudouridine1911/1915/1917 synthase